jgi:hypothetical protein
MRIHTSLFFVVILSALSLVSCVSDIQMVKERTEAESDTPVVHRAITQQAMETPTVLDTEVYDVFNARRDEGPIIPGIFQSAVPQGMAYLPERDLMLISNYMDDGRPSCIVALSMTTGDLQGVSWIEEPDGTPHMGHVGGLAVSRDHLWVASGPGVYFVDLDSLDGAETLRMTGYVQTAVKGSFATCADNTLWVGEFTSRSGNYPTDRSHRFSGPSGELYHGWMAGFCLDPDTDLIPPDRILTGVAYPNKIISIPHEVQGAVFSGDLLVLSQSYGRTNNSRVSIYANPLEDPPVDQFDDGESAIPLWVVDATDLLELVIAPPMTEGVVEYDGRTAVLFESGSDKYRSSALNPLDRIQILTLGAY